MLSTPTGRLRLVGLLEGASYVLLLGVAMPLKYYAGVPGAVSVVGWAHGVLFVAYLVVLLQCAHVRGWSILRLLGGLLAALLPFGTFVADRRLAREQAAAAHPDRP